jgi:Branched-chain amino acid ABC-type transport system, permease components
MIGFLQLVVNGIVVGSVFALGAAGISLVFGPLRIVNFAQGDYLTFGAYAAIAVNLGWGGNMIWSTLFDLLATAALAIGLEYVLWRPLRGAARR